MKNKKATNIDKFKRLGKAQQTDLPDTFVGVLAFTKRGGIVFTDHKLLDEDIIVRAPFLNGATEGQKVVVRLTRKPSKWRQPEGEIIEILGEPGDNETEMHAILAEFGLPYSYPKEVEEEANDLQEGATDEEILRRRDMRDALTFTIDPTDAKDFDDALSFQTLDNGEYEIGVHIADVTHYVKPDTKIDEEAFRRATSVYLVDRTIPMLPERLCNQICSLRPNEDKLCFSVIFTMNDEAKVLKSKICKTAIRSDRRFTYDEAQQVIETREGDCAEAILKLNDLAQILREERFAHGAIAFDREEPHIQVDENGKPIAITSRKQVAANNLIEEFMLLANRTVAQEIAKPKGLNAKAKTFVYRVHDVPDPERLANFGQFVKRFGFNLKNSSRKETTSKNLNHLLKQVQGRAEQNLIETLAVRAMAKAIYTTDNIGHYGLAFPYYTHFTSPIRRYPDIMVHRLLERYLIHGKASVDQQTYEDFCAHCSNREQLAANAERASEKYKQIEFMQQQVGNDFEAMITMITEWGVYAEVIENKCEGLIPMRDLQPTDFYVYDEKDFCLRGEYFGEIYRLGDILNVKVAKADLQRRQLDFEIVSR